MLGKSVLMLSFLVLAPVLAFAYETGEAHSFLFPDSEEQEKASILTLLHHCPLGICPGDAFIFLTRRRKNGIINPYEKRMQKQKTSVFGSFDACYVRRGEFFFFQFPGSRRG